MTSQNIWNFIFKLYFGLYSSNCTLTSYVTTSTDVFDFNFKNCLELVTKNSSKCIWFTYFLFKYYDFNFFFILNLKTLFPRKFNSQFKSVVKLKLGLVRQQKHESCKPRFGPTNIQVCPFMRVTISFKITR